MAHGLLRCCIAGALLLAAAPAAAQCMVGGTAVPVRYTRNVPQGDLAWTALGGGRVSILLHPAVRRLAPPVRHFLLAHECAHAELFTAHGAAAPHAETDADCRAITILATSGVVDDAGVRQIAAFFYPNAARPPRYPAGPIRARLIGECFRRVGRDAP